MQKTDLELFLEELARDCIPGQRLPTIRELMRRFNASQMAVQRSLQGLKARGLIASEVGRGTYFLGGAGSESGNAGIRTVPRSPAVRSVLLLRRSISIVRGRVLVDDLQRRFTADGHRTLEVSYTDPEHARSILKGLPNFDACVIQSTFTPITIDLLAALRGKTDVLAVDGAALAGSDVDAVGMEWGEPLAVAIAQLRQAGHRRIAYATTSHPFLASQLGRRRFEYLQKTLTDVELHEITVPRLPDGNYEDGLVNIIKSSLDELGGPSFTGLVAWGIEDGAKFRRLLEDIGISIPTSLSVVLLGRTDLGNEHAEFFDTIGCSVGDQAEYLYQAILARWADPTLPFGVRLIPVSGRIGKSIAAPRTTHRQTGRDAHKLTKDRGRPLTRTDP